MKANRLPKNVNRILSQTCHWNGAKIEQVDEYATGDVLHSLHNTNQTRLILTLEWLQ